MVDGETVPESDSQKHLGILYTVFSSSVHRTVERCSAGRSAFYALNGVGSRFGCQILLSSSTSHFASPFCSMVVSCGDSRDVS